MSAHPVGVAHARAGILGNPSDGYGGKALACSVRNFAARTAIEPSDAWTIVANDVATELAGIDGAVDAPVPGECEGLSRLVFAASRRFVHDFRSVLRIERPFTLTCRTDIPRQVGLAGSSAVIIATMRALATHFAVVVPPFDLAEAALATEVEDLDIAAGPMDRVIQTYEGVMAMDLAPPRSEAAYRRVDPSLIPPMIIAWDSAGGASSGVAHGDLRGRWRRGEQLVLDTIDELRDVVDRGMAALDAGDHKAFAELVDYNFALRCRVFPVGERDRQMVDLARAQGAAGKLCGSGGAVLVVPPVGADPQPFEQAFTAAGYRSCRPVIA